MCPVERQCVALNFLYSSSTFASCSFILNSSSLYKYNFCFGRLGFSCLILLVYVSQSQECWRSFVYFYVHLFGEYIFVTVSIFNFDEFSSLLFRNPK